MNVHFLLAALSGVFYAFAFPGFGWSLLIFVAWVPLLLAVRKVGYPKAILLGWVTGFVANIGGFYWVVHLLRTFANLGIFLAVLGLCLLALYQGLLVGVVVGLARYLDQRGKASLPWVFPLAFVAIEAVFPLLFPSYVGNALYRLTLLTQIVEIFGMAGLTAFITLINAMFFALAVSAMERRRPVGLLVPTGVIVFLVVGIYGWVRIGQVNASFHESKKFRVAVIQTNIGAQDKGRDPDRFLREHLELSRDALALSPNVDLLVWPESAHNRPINRSVTQLPSVSDDLGVPVLFGAITWDAPPGTYRRIFNSAVLTSSTGEVLGMFDKVELLAFGETIPFVDRLPALRRWLPHTTIFERGTSMKPFVLDGVRMLPMICYEDILPALPRRIWAEGGPADVLVNLTNDSWYGDTHEPLIHLALASFRSIEARRSLIRSTNTGISAVVDATGRIVQATGQWTKEVLISDVPLPREDAATPFMRFGPVLEWLSAGLLLGLVVFRKRKHPA